ncbi:hypothetical protein E4N75_13325 [Treponema putidum]|nr:hypothetical protein E4N75_13325 [Treponema putidum]
MNNLFENRRSRFKESGKKVPQAYRVYGEDNFLPCDAEDARRFKIPVVSNLIPSTPFSPKTLVFIV